MKTGKVWKELGPGTWASILEDTKSTSITTSGPVVKATCPYPDHHDKTPSFYIRTDLGFAKCFGCSKYSSNPVQFLATIKGISDAEAFLELRAHGAKLPQSLGKKIKEQEERRKVNGEITLLANSSLVSAVENREDPRWSFAQKAVDFLESRQVPIDSDLISQLPIGVLPPFSEIERNSALTRKPGIMEFFKGWLQDSYSNFVGALVFFYYESPTEISGFRIRYEFLKPAVYKDKQILAIGPKSDDTDIGFFGLANFAAKIGGNQRAKSPWKASKALVVEGEFDLLSLLVKYHTVEKVTLDPILCTQGSLMSNLDRAKTLGIDKLYLCLDNYHQDAGGLLRLKEVLASTSLDCYVFDWPLDAKDPDKAVVSLGWEATKEAIFSEVRGKRKNFTRAVTWCVDLAKEAIESCDPDDLRGILSQTSSIGKCLRNPLDNRAFISTVAQDTGISRALLTESILGRAETEKGFVYRAAMEVRELYDFIGLEFDSAKTSLLLWQKEHRRLRSIDVTKGLGDLIACMTTDLGALICWAEENLGLPDFIKYSGSGEKRVENSMLRQTQLQEQYLKIALAEVLKVTPMIGNLKKIGQGAHYVNTGGTGHSDKVHKWIVVNGDKVFISSPLNGESLTWEEYEDPTLGDMYFHLDRREKWSKELKTVDDLNSVSTSKEDFSRIWNKIYTMLKDGWTIQEGNAGMEYLVNAFFVNTVNTCVGRHLYTIINGARNTGKSSLTELLASSDYDWRLLECVLQSDGYTPAGIRNTMDSRAGGYFCDEFEVTSKEQDKASKVLKILTDQRGLVQKSEHVIQHGAPGGGKKRYVLKYQVWAASIEALRDPADISRYVRLSTKEVKGKTPPKKTLEDLHGLAAIAECRRYLTLCVYQYTNEFLSNVKKLREAYFGTGEPGFKSTPMKELKALSDGNVPDRLLGAAIITASMGQIAGRNPFKYIKEFFVSQRSSIQVITDSVESKNLFTDILSSSVRYQEIGNVTGKVTIRTLLSDPTDRERIGSLDVGLTYASFTDKRGSSKGKAYHYLIIEWTSLLPNLLRPNKPQTYGRFETPQKLKSRLSTDPLAIEWDDTVRKRIGSKRKYLKVGIKTGDVTVYNLTPIIEEWEND
tara:strand:- start:227 stop:3556 length:3330 start_codon:yes stop_codon:yes gene_type:complete